VNYNITTLSSVLEKENQITSGKFFLMKKADFSKLNIGGYRLLAM